MVQRNIVVPLGVERNDASGGERLTIAIGNFSYLATIGDFIKQRAASAGLNVNSSKGLRMKSRRCWIRPPKNG